MPAAMKKAMKAAAPAKAQKRKAEPAKDAPKAKKAKVEKKVDPVQEKLNQLTSAFTENCDCADTVAAVTANLEHLRKKVETRVTVEAEFVTVCETAFGVVEGELKEKTAAALAAVEAQKDTMKPEVEATEAATAKYDAACADFDAKKEASQTIDDAETDAINAVSDANTEKENLMEEGQKNGKWLETVQEGFKVTEAWTEAAAGTSKAEKKQVAEFSKLLKKTNADQSMLSGLEAALCTYPREGFSGIVFTCVQQHCTKYVEELNAKIQSQEAREAEATNKIAELQTVADAKIAEAAEAKTTMQTAKEFKKECDKEKKAAEKAMSGQKKELDSLEDAHAACVATEGTFTETLAVFAELKAHTDIVPEVEEPVEEEVVDNSGDVQMEDAQEESPEAQEEEQFESPAKEEEKAEEPVEEAAPVEEQAEEVAEEAPAAVEEEVVEAPVEEAAAPVVEEPVEEKVEEAAQEPEEKWAPAVESPVAEQQQEQFQGSFY